MAVAGMFPAGALRDRFVAAAKEFRALFFDWTRLPPAGTPAYSHLP